jgi:cyclophilin family peptidyl-prolyl cis-trans isomerase
MSKTYIIIIILLAVFGGIWLATKNAKQNEVPPPTTLDKLLPDQVKEGGESVKVINQVDENKNTMEATIKTNKGEIVIEFSNDAPKTVENFKKLASEGFYNGTKFHRVIKGFMIQGGDPLTKDDSKMAMWGTGGPGYKFNDEITANNKNDVGTISMANSGPNTNGSQFFINVNANNFLDTKHTVFGKVKKGMNVVTAIENTPTGPNDRPTEAVIIESVTLK